MIFIVLLFFICACGMETSIVGVVDNNSDDTSEIVPDVTITDTTDTSFTTPSLEGVVGYVNYTFQQVACQNCLGVTQEITLDFSATFHNRITDTHTSWMPGVGSCIENVAETSPAHTPIDVGSSLQVSGPVSSFSVPRIGQNTYQTSNIYETQYDRDGTHTVYSEAISDGFTFISSRGFDYIEPFSLLYVDMSYAYQAPIYTTGTTFYWGPSGSGEKFMIIIAVYTSNGSSLLGYVACMGEDIGYMTIPGEYLSSYSQGSLVAVHLSRQSIDMSPSYDLGGYVETHMVWEVVGTGHIE